jgi:septum formation protein
MNILLASTSPTRASLLRNAGVSFTPVKPRLDEERFQSARQPGTENSLALELAQAKSLSLAALHHDALIIGSDQTLLCDKELIHKARDAATARATLHELRGKPHTLRSAVAVSHAGKIIFTALEDATITMRNYSDSYLDDYMSAEGPAILSSVGCYHFEGRGIQLMEKVEGSYFAILGLPLLPLLHFLRTRHAVAI